MTNSPTTAEAIADLMGYDGLCFTAPDGRDLDDVMTERRAREEYSRTVHSRDGACRHEPCMAGEYLSGDPVRHVFDDGSAIVVAGDAWDVEGEAPFSWAGT